MGDVGIQCGAEPWPFWQAQSVFTWEVGHSRLLLGLMKKTGRDRKPQMRTEAVYMALCIPDCPCRCLVYPLGKWSDAPGPWTAAVHVNKFPPNIMSVPLSAHTLSAGEIKLKELRVQFCPGGPSSLCCSEEEIAPEWFSYLKKKLWVMGWTAVIHRGRV